MLQKAVLKKPMSLIHEDSLRKLRTLSARAKPSRKSQSDKPHAIPPKELGPAGLFYYPPQIPSNNLASLVGR